MRPVRGRVPALAPARAPALVQAVIRSPGVPLPAAIRTVWERRLGQDFSAVRIHADALAARSAGAVGAEAWAAGRHIAFATDRYRPDSAQGRALLAHELAHVAQQAAAASVPDTLPVAPIDGAAEREATRIASGAARRPVAPVAPLLQRQASEAGPHASRKLAAFDTDRRPNRRPWNLDRLSREVAEALAASDRAFVRVFAVRPAEATDEAATDHALQRADTVCRALVQWIGPSRAPEERFEIGLASGTAEDPQVEVWLAYRPQVLSDPREPLSAAPAVPAAPTPADASPSGLSKYTKFGIDIGKGRLDFVLPSSATLRLPRQFGQDKRLVFELKAETKGAFGISVKLQGIKGVEPFASASANVVKESAQAEVGVTFTRVVKRATGEEIRASLQLKGQTVVDKVRAYETAHAASTGTNEDTKKEVEAAAEVAQALSDLYDEIERAREAAKDTPVGSLKIGATRPPPPDSSKPVDPNAPTAGADTVMLNFELRF